MINSLANSIVNWRVARAMKDYHNYPTDKTAVVLVDVQNAFVSDRSDLFERLWSLVEFARGKGIRVIHAPSSAAVERAFPTPAHLEMRRLLQKGDDGEAIVAALGPSESDVTLSPRSTLSVFGLQELDEALEAYGLEHLVFAGPLANITIDSSVRDAVQRDCHVTVLSDCISGASQSAVDHELQHTLPRYAHLITDLSGWRKLVK